MPRRLALVVPVALAGCIDIPPPLGGTPDAAPDATTLDCRDGDGDFWPGTGLECSALAVIDCDDADPAIHPGAREAPDNVSDLDCDDLPWNGGGLMPPLIVNTDGIDPIITARGTVLTFDPSQAHAITSMTIATSPQLLHTTFSDERYVGVEAWPSMFSWATGGLDGLQLLSNTDTVAQIRVDWQDGFGAGIDDDMHGVSVWTFHADGRIYRREEATVVTEQSVSSLSSYIATQGQHFTVSQSEGQASPVPLDINMGDFDLPTSTAAVNAWLCIADDGAPEPYEVGMVSRPTAPQTRPAERVRITGTQSTSGDDSELLSLQYDWRYGTGMSPANGSYAVSSHIIAGLSDAAGPCVATNAAAAAWRAPPPLDVTGGQRITLPDGTDDNGDGFAEGVGYYEVQWEDRSFALSLPNVGMTGRGVTFRIRGMPPGDPIVMRNDGTTTTRLLHGQRYLTAVDGDTRWLMVVMDPGDSLTFTSP